MFMQIVIQEYSEVDETPKKHSYQKIMQFY